MRHMQWRLKTYSACLLYTLIFVLFLKVFWPRSKSSTSIPKWFERNPDSCSSAKNIAFLKTHKAASSTVQNILFRHGLKNDLLFALPKYDVYFGGAIPFHADMVARMDPFNIFAVHTKWDHQQIRSIMPNNTVFFTIVRDPVHLFESLFSYLQIDKIKNMTLDEFVTKMDITSPRVYSYIGLNQMVWDFGLPLNQMNNHTTIQELVMEAEKNFDLVMVAERMEESIILMRHLLCMNTRDVASLKINTRQKAKTILTPETRRLLKQKLAPDYQLYDHFYEKFNNLVNAFGQNRMTKEISQLKREKREVMEYCHLNELTDGHGSRANKPWSPLVIAYESANTTLSCQTLTWAEPYFMEYLRHQQRRKSHKSKFG